MSLTDWLLDSDPALPDGEPSKWLTLFGTRVLAWWDGLDALPDS